MVYGPQITQINTDYKNYKKISEGRAVRDRNSCNSWAFFIHLRTHEALPFFLILRLRV